MNHVKPNSSSGIERIVAAVSRSEATNPGTETEKPTADDLPSVQPPVLPETPRG